MKSWLLLLLIASAQAKVKGFNAVYQIKLDQQTKGLAYFQLVITEKRYRFEALTQPAEDNTEILEISTGRLVQSRPLPDHYYYQLSQENQWLSFIFNWQQNILLVQTEQKKQGFQLEVGSQDRLSYLLRALMLVDSEQKKALFPVINLDKTQSVWMEKKQQHSVQVPAGRFLAQSVQIRFEGEQDRTLWVSPSLGFVPILLEKPTPQGRLKIELIRLNSEK